MLRTTMTEAEARAAKHTEEAYAAGRAAAERNATCYKPGWEIAGSQFWKDREAYLRGVREWQDDEFCREHDC